MQCFVIFHITHKILGMGRDSSQLVPGDIVDLSTSQLSVVPSDLFLLSGDAIVNESMLTGESVPVSKTPIKDGDLVEWLNGKEENSRAFLYGGTRVVRIRGTLAVDGPSRPALAMVARTSKLLQKLIVFLIPLSYRLQHNKGRLGSFHVVPETHWLQVLS